MKLVQQYIFWGICLFISPITGLGQGGVPGRYPPVTSSVGQQYPMPAFDMNRANDTAYITDRVNTTHALLRQEQLKPAALHRDSTVLRLYNYLGSLYRETQSHKDSCLYYGRKMVEYATACRNLEFRVKGLFQQSLYYRNIKLSPAEALRVNLKAYDLLENADHDPQVFWRICYNLGELYASIRDYDNALRYYQQADISIKSGTGLSTVSTYAYTNAIWQGIAVIYTQKQQYALAEPYFRQATETLSRISIKGSHATLYYDFANFFYRQKQYRQAIDYNKKAEEIWAALDQSGSLSMARSRLALCYLELNDLNAAQRYGLQALTANQPALTGLRDAHNALYQVAFKQGDWQNSLTYFKKYVSVQDSLETIFKQEELYKIQSRFDLEKAELKNSQLKGLQQRELLNIRQKSDLATLKVAADRQQFSDQITRETLKRQLENQTLREQGMSQQTRAVAEKSAQEKIINTLKIKELEQEKVLESRTRNALAFGLFITAVLGATLLWANRRLITSNQELKTKNDLIKEATHKIQATEMAALRAQMNPHFIFNCLNSIQFFTAQNNTDKASDYLTKFSRLIRLVLENSKSDKVTLANELETLKLYIEMEAMRFQQKVQYSILIDGLIDTESVQIPPLLLQPFVENAIWHGLMHKEEGGTVTVSVQQPQPDCLRVQITDDGVGRAKAAEYKSKSATKSKSLGMKLTADRIELINQLYQTQTHITITDLTNATGQPTGTRVIIEIPL